MNEETVAIVSAILEEDRQQTIRQIEQQIAAEYAYVQVSLGSIHSIIHDHLQMTKVSARWVPRELTADHMRDGMGAALEFLSRYHEYGEAFLDQIVTGDECWVHFYTPESKRSSMTWKTKDEPTPKKFKVVPSAGAVMLTFFWDREGPLLIEFLPTQKVKGKRRTVTQDTYFDTMIRLRQAIKAKRRGKLSQKICLLHDNARPHTARLIALLLNDFKWFTFPHPPCSPDLAPSDFHAFPGLTEWLGGQRFEDEESCKAAVTAFFEKQGREWYDAGIVKLIHRYEKYLARSGDYVEK